MKRILSREFRSLLVHDVASNKDGKVFYSSHGTRIFVPLEDLLAWFETVEATVGLDIPDWRYKTEDMAYEEEINKGHWTDLWLLHGLCPEALEGHIEESLMNAEDERILDAVKKSTADICGMQYAAQKETLHDETKREFIRKHRIDFDSLPELKLIHSEGQSLKDVEEIDDEEFYQNLEEAVRNLASEVPPQKYENISMGCLVPKPPPCSICAEAKDSKDSFLDGAFRYPESRCVMSQENIDALEEAIVPLSPLAQIYRDKLEELKPVLDSLSELGAPTKGGTFMGGDEEYPAKTEKFSTQPCSECGQRFSCSYKEVRSMGEPCQLFNPWKDEQAFTTWDGKRLAQPCSACAAQGFCDFEESRGGVPCASFSEPPGPEEK